LARNSFAILTIFLKQKIQIEHGKTEHDDCEDYSLKTLSLDSDIFGVSGSESHSFFSWDLNFYGNTKDGCQLRKGDDRSLRKC